MFSKSFEYAIKAIIFVAQKSKDIVHVGVKQVAKGIDAPNYCKNITRFRKKVINKFS